MWQMNNVSPEEAIAGFLGKYTPDIAARARGVLTKMRERLPGAVELVYDNYNALVIGFGPTDRPSEAVFSIAVYPRWVSLVFLQGAGLPDPYRLLKGRGKRVRHIVLAGPETLDLSAVRTLIARALRHAPKPFDPTQPHRIMIKSISPKQRPRRPR